MGILRPFYVDSPSTWDDQDDGLDFSSDPDQRHAKLPQPFRLVNKILDCLFEDTWASITTRQALKESQANFSQLPNVSFLFIVIGVEKLNYLLNSKKGNRIA